MRVSDVLIERKRQSKPIYEPVHSDDELEG